MVFGLNTPDIRFGHRNPNSDPEKRREYIDHLVNLLLEFEERTDPKGGNETSKGKDMNAFQALHYVGELVEELAGWAVDHQIGLGLEGHSFVPFQPNKTKQHPEYLAAKAAVDDHRHEAAGFEFVKKALTEGHRGSPHAERQMITNLLRALSTSFSHNLANRMIEALEALKYGEVQPILAPSGTTLGEHGYSEWSLRMRALECVEYLRARGFTKKAAQDKVGNALGRSQSGIRWWEKEVRTRLGSLEVSRRLAFAWNGGKNAEAAKREGDALAFQWHDSGLGEPALRDIKKQYDAILRSKQATPDSE